MTGPRTNHVAIVTENVGVCYDLRLTERLTFRRGVNEWVGDMLERRRGNSKFWALRDVSFTVRRGEILGVLGRNGSGKSTLLLTIAGILQPDQGRIATFGRTSTLLSLGIGFEPEASGLENIYLNGAFLGLTQRQMDAKRSAIVAFSELGEFINAPLRTYSSGMRQRLGFAIAAHIEPEILLLDEVLEVGDAAFKEKCVAKLEELIARASAIVVVTHSTKFVVEKCSHALWLHEGSVAGLGEPREIVERYVEAMSTIGGPVRRVGQGGRNASASVV
jgi:ABC-type polysaccharide/polyol phosphate transport system ATPase subunit